MTDKQASNLNTNSDPNVKQLANPLHALSYGLGSGLIKPAPGTWGTLASLPIWWFLLADLALIPYLIVVLVSFVIGCYLCSYTSNALGTHDHGAIVWDEFVGMWITLILVPKTVVALAIGFVFFRIFDIIKPFPIKWLDKHVHGGFGIMIDDVLAGIFAVISMSSMGNNFKAGVYTPARFVASPNFDDRPEGEKPEVIIIHSISLPPGEYEKDYVECFFCNELDPNEHPYFKDICHLTVSSHFYIRRTGEVVQFVNTDKRAWHAGVSECLGRECVKDFSIGIELEGWDEADDGFSEEQYQQLNVLIDEIAQEYNIDKKNLYAHSDIAPGRKNDPGPYFRWEEITE